MVDLFMECIYKVLDGILKIIIDLIDILNNYTLKFLYDYFYLNKIEKYHRKVFITARFIKYYQEKEHYLLLVIQPILFFTCNFLQRIIKKSG